MLCQRGFELSESGRLVCLRSSGRGWKMTTAHTDLREDNAACICQEMLATGLARGRHEEHLRACKMIRRVIVEIADARFPLIAAFIQERVERMDHFVALH